MIAVFKPVNNAPGYDLRELHLVNGIIKVKRWLSISEHIGFIDEYPVFKPLVVCKDKKEFREQFKHIEESFNNNL